MGGLLGGLDVSIRSWARSGNLEEGISFEVTRLAPRRFDYSAPEEPFSDS